MIIENTSQIELRTRWNRHLKQDVVDAKINNQWQVIGALVLGEQQHGHGLISTTTLPLSPTRTACDLQTAQTRFRQRC